MPLKLVLALLLSVVFARDCTGDIVHDVTSWNLTVFNAGPGDAIVGISAQDLHRRAVVPAGDSVTATTYAGGSIVISASPAADVVAQLKTRRDQLTAKLAAKPIDLVTSVEIYNQLIQVNAEIRAYESEQHGSVCTMELHMPVGGQEEDRPGFVWRATFDGSRFNLNCDN
jgi:hypothetical protein